MEKQKKAEAKKSEVFKATHQVDHLYGLAHGPADNPTIFYVGVAQSYLERFNDHRASALTGDPAPKYEYFRKVGISNVYPLLLDDTGELTEADWMATLREAGHPLQNEAEGNGKRKKKRIADIAAAMAPVKKSPAFKKAMTNTLDWRGGWKK